MRWGQFLLGLGGLLAFGALAGLMVMGIVGAAGKLGEGAGGLLGIVIMAALAALCFFIAMASTAAMLVAWDRRRAAEGRE
jgi:hypothetical protein